MTRQARSYPHGKEGRTHGFRLGFRQHALSCMQEMWVCLSKRATRTGLLQAAEMRRRHMLTYKLESNDGNTVTYSYCPEGRTGDIGTVFVDSTTGEPRSIKPSSYDVTNTYGGTLLGHIKEWMKSGNLKEPGTLAVY